MHPDLFTFGMLLTGHSTMARLDHSAAATFLKSIGPEFVTQAVHCNLQPLTTPMGASNQCTHGAYGERTIRLLVTSARHDVLATKSDNFTCM